MRREEKIREERRRKAKKGEEKKRKEKRREEKKGEERRRKEKRREGKRGIISSVRKDLVREDESC